MLHPGRLTWNLQITHLERKMIFQTSMIMFHVNLQGCIPTSTNAKSHACPKPTSNATLYMVHQLGDLFSWDALGKIFEELEANELVLGLPWLEENIRKWCNKHEGLPFLELGYELIVYIYIIHISWYIYICWYISTNDEWKLSLMQRPWTTVDSHNFFQQQNDKVEPSLEIQEVLKRSQKRMIWYSKVKAASDSQGNQL